jgi:aryl-alcohol dehydrogenase-like predicted oxidoreductase
MFLVLVAMAAALQGGAERTQLPSALRGAPRLGLGLASLGRPGYINLGHEDDLPDERSVEQMRVHAHTVLDAAFDLGLRYFDCARSYGLSEEFVASWLESRPDAAEAIVVGSKWGYEYTADWRVEVGDGEAHEVKKHTVEQFVKQLSETRELLGTKLALYQIHSATQESGVLESVPVLKALSGLRAEGVAVGASVSHPQVPTLEQAIPLAVSGGGAPLFGSVQATFNLLDQSAGPALRAAAEQGVFVIIKEALANGRLTPRAGDSPAVMALKTEAQALGTSVDALALAWVLSHDWVSMCLSGASTVEQLRSNADALRLVPLPDDVMGRLADAARQDCEIY